ncbi:dimethylglycine dehydrogenase, mitochondrial [Trichonephila clavipes]|nr:dimethylglycine dehydrogenase, mitochondrial [Trichonephila clavipes]
MPPLGRKLVVKITCGDWYPPLWCRTKRGIPDSGECTRSAKQSGKSADIQSVCRLRHFPASSKTSMPSKACVRDNVSSSKLCFQMNMDSNPLEAGLDYFIRMDKQDFIGKAALEKVLQEGLNRKLVYLKVHSKNVDPDGNESIWCCNKVRTFC